MPGGRRSGAPTLPSRADVLAFIENAGDGKVGKREIARAFGVSGPARRDLQAMIAEMADEGLFGRAGGRPERRRAVPSVGVYQVVSVDTHGDAIARPLGRDGPEDGEGLAVRLSHRPEPGRSARKGVAAPGVGDRILLRIVGAGEDGVPEARVIKRLDRAPPRIVGVFRKDGRGGEVKPVSRKERAVRVSLAASMGAEEGELVAVAVDAAPRLGQPGGHVIERFGDVSGEAAISLIALEEHGIPYVFPAEVLADAEAAEEPGPEGREDWRDLPLVTIDPRDARDHDDAVHARPDPGQPGGHVVTVAIADVSWFVRPGSALDREALRRGNSVYFPGRVVPMLPERISNDLCSLKEGVDRPALAVRMWFDGTGRKVRHAFHRILMRSHARLAYEDAQAAIEGRDGHGVAPDIVEAALRPLWTAYAALKHGRDRREPLEITAPEKKVLLKPDGSVDRIVVPPRLAAHMLIEEFMIQANVAAAETLVARSTPLLFRVHDEPQREKLESLRDFLATLDLAIPRGAGVRPTNFNRVLERVAGTPHEALVNEVVLRSQAQAVYQPDNIGHFGLNLAKYAHFTSPIRRYADLIVHRGLVTALRLGEGGLSSREAAELARVGEEVSMTERRAMAAERDTIDRLVAAFLEARVGEIVEGRIRGVTKAGLFIELAETGGDGFVPVSTIGAEFFVHDAQRHALVGRATGTRYTLGDTVRVEIAEADRVTGGLLLRLVDGGDGTRPARGRTDPRRGPRGPSVPRRSRRTRA